MYCFKRYPGVVEYDNHDTDSSRCPPDLDSNASRGCNDLRKGTEE